MANEIEKGTLYVVGTPIGNLSDMSERAKYVLANVDFVAAEDTRVSGKLLSAYGIKNSFVSYHEHNKATSGKMILERLLSGESCALVTDAGMPAISDPGEELVCLCKKNSVKVVPVPGACAFVSALAASGFSSRRFVFEGFLPSDKKQAQEVLCDCKNEKRTVIFYEAPHRLLKTLKLMLDSFGDRNVCLARELTKLNEEIVTTTLSKAVETYSLREPRGEYVIVVGGDDGSCENAFFENMTVEEHVEFYINQGMKKMDAIKECAKDRGVAKNEVYKHFV